MHPASHAPQPRPVPSLALLFDLDGTLVDSIDLILTSFRHAFAEVVGRVPPDEAWIAGIGTPLAIQMRELAGDESLVAPLVDSYRAFQRAHHDRLLREYEGVRETLETLRARGHPMAVVTSKAAEMTQRALRRAGLASLIDVVIDCDMCARHKPDPLPVLLALERLAHAPGDALFVGDSPHDIAAGNSAGVRTVAALWGPFSRAVLEAAHPRFVLEDIRELPALVEALQLPPPEPRHSNLPPHSAI